jgi:hypothetical protein
MTESITMIRKNILVLASSKSGRIRHKHVEFKADKHVVIAGNLCHKANPLKVIGHITRCYSEPDAADTAAVTDACTAGQPPHTLQQTD